MFTSLRLHGGTKGFCPVWGVTTLYTTLERFDVALRCYTEVFILDVPGPFLDITKAREYPLWSLRALSPVRCCLPAPCLLPLCWCPCVCVLSCPSLCCPPLLVPAATGLGALSAFWFLLVFWSFVSRFFRSSVLRSDAQC